MPKAPVIPIIVGGANQGNWRKADQSLKPRGMCAVRVPAASRPCLRVYWDIHPRLTFRCWRRRRDLARPSVHPCASLRMAVPDGSKFSSLSHERIAICLAGHSLVSIECHLTSRVCPLATAPERHTPSKVNPYRSAARRDGRLSSKQRHTSRA